MIGILHLISLYCRLLQCKLLVAPILVHKKSDVKPFFADAAAMNGEHYVKEDRESEGLGMVFYFCPVQEEVQTPERSVIDTYVYCVEEDDFGITYHRFSWSDFQKCRIRLILMNVRAARCRNRNTVAVFHIRNLHAAKPPLCLLRKFLQRFL